MHVELGANVALFSEQLGESERISDPHRTWCLCDGHRDTHTHVHTHADTLIRPECFSANEDLLLVWHLLRRQRGFIPLRQQEVTDGAGRS